MKFRQKIWALPLSACVVFGLGIAASLLIATRSTSQLEQLRSTDNRLLELTLQVDRFSDQLETALEGASMGDSKRLTDAKAHAAAIEQLLANAPDTLRQSFTTYRGEAFGVVQGMLAGEDVTERITKRRTALSAWNAERKAGLEQARGSVEAGFDALAVALRNTVIASAVTALAVLAVLGGASWLLVRSVWRDLGGEPEDLRRLAERVASGELDTPVAPGIDGSLQSAMGSMAARLRETVSVIRDASESINAAAGEIAAGNQDLSQRTERAAANLQETSASVQQLASAAHDSGQTAMMANQLAASAAEAAGQGGAVMSQVVDSMHAIDESSRRIGEIIGVIDAIAFQTNILALNAAVEAARAGEQGRGFAVVASEVRTLAKRSAEAASQIKVLIQSSAHKVQGGATLVQEAGEAMTRIVASVGRVTSMIDGLHQASSRQAGDIGGLNDVIGALDGMTQQNAALVEQSAAASMSLQAQTHRLSASLAAFRLQAA